MWGRGLHGTPSKIGAQKLASLLVTDDSGCMHVPMSKLSQPDPLPKSHCFMCCCFPKLFSFSVSGVKDSVRSWCSHPKHVFCSLFVLCVQKASVHLMPWTTVLLRYCQPLIPTRLGWSASCAPLAVPEWHQPQQCWRS